MNPAVIISREEVKPSVVGRLGSLLLEFAGDRQERNQTIALIDKVTVKKRQSVG